MRRRKSGAREALETALFCAAATALFAALPFEGPAKAEAGACCDMLVVSGSQGDMPPWPRAPRMPTGRHGNAGDAAGARAYCPSRQTGNQHSPQESANICGTNPPGALPSLP
jgi:hypothetical protein